MHQTEGEHVAQDDGGDGLRGTGHGILLVGTHKLNENGVDMNQTDTYLKEAFITCTKGETATSPSHHHTHHRHITLTSDVARIGGKRVGG